MSDIGSRPYVGTWRLSATKLVQHTPDALVYINGDTALPGCLKCNGRIDIQQFITEVSVDAGTGPGDHTASFSLSIPMHHTDSFARDAKFLLRPGLEIHVYLRGYFPVKGLYEHLAEPSIPDEAIGTSGQETTAQIQAPDLVAAKSSKNKITTKMLITARSCARIQAEGRAVGGCTPAHFTDAYLEELQVLFEDPGLTREKIESNLAETAGMMNSLQSYLSEYLKAPVQVRTKDGLSSPKPGGKGHVETSEHYVGTGVDHTVKVRRDGKWVPVSNTLIWAAQRKLRETGHFPRGGDGVYLEAGQSPNSWPKWSDTGHMDHGPTRDWVWEGGVSQPKGRKEAWLEAMQPNVDKLPTPSKKVPAWKSGVTVTASVDVVARKTAGAVPTQGAKGPATEFETIQGDQSLLSQLGLAGQGIEKVLAYPYYHAFRGVITQVDHSYSGGVQSVSVSCASLLHFWQHHNMSTNASVFGARPLNSKLRRSMLGHVFTGMHPYQIIWTLHHDMVGAAGGVAWALRSKSNQSAKTEFGGESLFSLNIRYWERRFALRETKLRLHGATGELFSSMQSAFLARTKGGHLSQLIRSRFGNKSDTKAAAGLVQQAKSVGLFNRHKLAALNFASRSKGGAAANTTRFEINLIEMHAFVSNIGNWGQINLFESAYESKLDIAQKVMDITGFEFYQDVDGDFVFKPPMYNLDTSGSRVYRIEDIDIQNISFSEKEPECTYMTVTGSHFKNLQGLGLDGEWGVKGQYIDYRLVAQFGWRPGDFETAYFNDPKSMFFSAMNRMDNLNIGVNSASVTIPIRAEMRPGYPVYIPYLDCFYYCNSFAHSYSAGGSCTTSLQLVGKRAKFYAPGNPGGSGIDRIDLGNTVLPERPLEILGLDGKPRLAGFPNVVMALDPDHINPLFYIVGTDIENLATSKGKGKKTTWEADERVLRNLLRSAKSLGLVDHVSEDGIYTITVTSGGKAVPVEFFFNPGGGKATGNQTDLVAAAIQYGKAQEATFKKKTDSDPQRAKDERAIEVLRGKFSVANDEANRAEAGSPEAERAEKLALSLSIKISDQETKLESEIKSAASGESIFDGVLSQDDYKQAALLRDLLQTVSNSYRQKVGDQRFGDFDSTINLLDMLSDKKATFSNGTQPGGYRYYSASHPSPFQQGQPILQYNREFLDVDDMERGSTVTLDQVAAEVDPDWDFPTHQFLPTAQVHAPAPDMKMPEAQLVPGKNAKFGIRVLTSNSAKPLGEVLPTSEIRELMFSVQSSVFAQVGSVTQSVAFREVVKESVEKALNDAFDEAIVEDPKLTPQEMWGPVAKTFWTNVNASADAAAKFESFLRQQAGLDPTHTFFPRQDSGLPYELIIGKQGFDTELPFSAYAYKGNPDIPVGSVLTHPIKNPFKHSLRVFIQSFSTAASQQIFTQFWGFYEDDWKKDMGKAFGKKLAKRLVPEVTSHFWERMLVSYDFRVVAINTVLLAKARKKKDISFSPVFPVSDARGYHVIGSYRYGRDVAISPNGVWDQMANQDPLSVLNRETRDQLLQLYVQGRSISVMLPEMKRTGTNEDGTERWEQVKPVRLVPQTITPKSPGSKGNSQQTELTKSYERYLLEQLRRSLSNTQILEYGLATVGENPNVLEMNLANWMSDGREGIHKVPVINAAYSLADLGLHTSQSVCSCKAAEASVLIDAYGQLEFLPIADGSPDIPEGVDKGTQFVMQANLKASLQWRAAQNAMRGTSPDRGRSNLLDTFRNAGGQFREATRQLESERATLDAKAREFHKKKADSGRNEE